MRNSCLSIYFVFVWNIDELLQHLLPAVVITPTRYDIIDYTLMSIGFFSCIKLCILQDPNPSVMFKMVEPLTTLQEKVRKYLDEWPDHPGLMKILDTIASLLAMPLSTPISKVCYPINVCNTNVLLSTCSMFLLCFLFLRPCLDCNCWLWKLKHCRKMTPSSF